MQVLDDGSGQKAPLGGGGVLRSHQRFCLAGLGQHHKPVVVDVHGVFQQRGPGLAQLLEGAAPEYQLVQLLLLLPVVGENGERPVQHLPVGQLRHGDPVCLAFNGAAADTGKPVPGKALGICPPDQVKSPGLHGLLGAVNLHVIIGDAAAGILHQPPGKALGHHGDAGIHMGQCVFSCHKPSSLQSVLRYKRIISAKIRNVKGSDGRNEENTKRDFRRIDKQARFW